VLKHFIVLNRTEHFSITSSSTHHFSGWWARLLGRFFRPAIAPESTNQPNTTHQSTTMNMTTAQKLSTAARQPMIKFVGARLPRPKYDPSKLPPIDTKASSSTNVSPPNKGNVNSVYVDAFQLPSQFRRRPLSEEEIAIINNGGLRQ
jgi:hypothetical protein